MSKAPSKTSRLPQMRVMIASLALFGAILVAVFNKGGGGNGSAAPDSTSGDSSPASRQVVRGTDHGSEGAPAVTRRTRSSVNRVSSEDGEDEDPEAEGPRYPLVEQVLDDESITDEVAVQRLLEIVMNRGLSVGERLDAFAHGANLDMNAFRSIAAEPDLPLEIAEDFAMRLDDLPSGSASQIEGYLALLNHLDDGIREQAAEQLAFALEEESLAEDPAALQELAVRRLKELAEAPPEPEDEEPADLDPDMELVPLPKLPDGTTIDPTAPPPPPLGEVVESLPDDDE